MKTFYAVVIAFILAGTVQGAQDRTASAGALSVASASQPKVDPAKGADIQRLLEVAGTASLVQQLIANMEQSIKPLMTNSLPPGEYRARLIDLFFERFNSKLDAKRLLDLAAARYDENFSDEEIRELIGFYQTPVGQKLVTLLPKLTGQLQQDGQKLGQQLGRESMIEVLSEHPDLAQAMRAASHKTSPDSQ